MDTRIDIQKTDQRKWSLSPRATWLLAGFGVGIIAMYYTDPQRGTYRRHVLRDRFFRLTRRSEDLVLRGFRDIANRTRGAWHRYQFPLDTQVDDEILVQRIRAEFGKKVSHPKAISTQVRDGVVTLSGPILSSEVRPVVRCVRKVAGVKHVINNLEVRQHADHVSSLQGQGKQYLQ